jgi:hypothetical protein
MHLAFQEVKPLLAYVLGNGLLLIQDWQNI